MSTRSKQLGGVRASLANSYATLGTVPAGRVWLVKSCLAYAPAASQVYLGFARGGLAWDPVRWDLAAGASIRPSDSAVWLVLVAGDTLRIYTTAASVTAVVSGADLPAPV